MWNKNKKKYKVKYNSSGLPTPKEILLWKLVTLVILMALPNQNKDDLKRSKKLVHTCCTQVNIKMKKDKETEEGKKNKSIQQA